MRILTSLGLILIMFIAGCSRSGDADVTTGTPRASPPGTSASLGNSVPLDDPALSHSDDAGETPDGVLLAYVAAVNAADWKAAYALMAPGKGDYETFVRDWSTGRQGFEDFTIREVRVAAADRALVRVTGSQWGTSAVDGSQKLVEISGPWWVLDKVDGLWKVTSRGPWD